VTGTPVEAIERHQTELALKWTRVQDGEVFEDDELVVTIVGLPVPFTNNVHRSRLSSQGVERRVAKTAALLRDRGVPALWWIGPLDTPGELPDVVQRNGFRHAEDMPWMAAGLDTVANPPLPPGIEANRAATPELFDRFVEAMMLGFGDDAGGANAMRSLRASVGSGEDAGWQPFVALRDGEPVGSSGLQLGGGVAGVYNVATPPAHRGRGIGSAMTTLAMRWARDHGYDTAVLGSSPKAVPLYERLGFRFVCRMGVYVFQP
jgi:GNAT superfamily N-acetyltransferase